MTYTVTINDTSEKARSIVKMLKELSKDYHFLKVYDDNSELSEELQKELEIRLAYVIKNPEIGKNWDELKSSFPL
ncbi:MAG: hypothetical protein Q8M08_05510 [Bacteroidales bacterium]|nr:hypothetical protein [Bacteroidales bacterium]